ncbi:MULTISPECIES: LysR family transcriptional regulator [unclassified Moraxella]|uniref:LysR family transcriptional regulator n=1 Tax=unclassified Moraxella TaxID=2685852 RepID=UPI003AF9575F
MSSLNQLKITPVTKDNWIEAVKEEAEQDGCSLTTIADKIGYARPSLSLAVSGKYVGSTDHIRDAYIEYRKQVLCPYINDTVSRSYCIDHATGDAPTHHPAKLRHWQACKKCEFCPERGNSEALLLPSARAKLGLAGEEK